MPLSSAAGLLAATLLSSAAADAVPATADAWRLTARQGSVVMLVDGKSAPAPLDQMLPARAVIVTGAGARAELVRGGDRVELAAGTRLRLYGAGTGGMTADSGVVTLSVASSVAGQTALATPFLSAVTTGATLRVTVSQTGATVRVVEGAARLATLDAGATRLIGTGTIGMVGVEHMGWLILDGAERGIIQSSQDVREADSERLEPLAERKARFMARRSGTAVEIAAVP